MAEMYDSNIPPKVPQQVNYDYDEDDQEQLDKQQQQTTAPVVLDHPTTHHQLATNYATYPDIWRDIALWKRKQLNIVLLSLATAAWTTMEIYQYNFVTILCYVTIAIFTSLFLWGNIHRLLKKEVPDLRGLEISEGVFMEMAASVRQMIEKGVRLMFHVSVEREWFVFAGVVASLYVLSLVAGCVNLLTLCYIGLVGSMTVPVMYMKNQNIINQYGEKMKMHSRRFYKVMEARLQAMKDKMAGQQKEVKEKKME